MVEPPYAARKGNGVSFLLAYEGVKVIQLAKVAQFISSSYLSALPSRLADTADEHCPDLHESDNGRGSSGSRIFRDVEISDCEGFNSALNSPSEGRVLYHLACS